jgi:hypothetical protein
MVEFPEEAGYPVGGDSPVKYYMIQMHYDNSKESSSRILLVFDNRIVSNNF